VIGRRALPAVELAAFAYLVMLCRWVLAAYSVFLVVLCSSEDACPAGAGATCTAGPSNGADIETRHVVAESSDGRATRVPVQATADLITQEVDELKAFMGLCEERIKLLEELKTTVKSGVNLSLPESHLKMLQEQLPLMSEVTMDEDRAPSSSADDYLISKAVIPQEETIGFIKFLPLRNPRTSQPASSGQTAMPSAILVAVQAEKADAKVLLFTPQGEMVLAFKTDHKHPVVHLAVSPSHDENFIATADAGGFIQVYRINVKQRRLTKDQKQSRRNSTDEKVSQYLGSQVNVTAQFTKQMQVPADQLGADGEPPKFTTLTVASQQGTKYFVAGDEEGYIHIFTRNGTFHTKLQSAVPGRIEELSAQLSHLLFRVGSEWGFVNLEKMEMQRMDCQKFEGRVTTAVVDSQQSSRILVADEEGTVWVFNVKDKKNCKAEHKFTKGSTQAPIELASVRGFAIGLERAGLGGDEVSVLALNLSHVGKSKSSLMGATSPVVWRKGRPAVRDWTVHKRYQQGDLLAFLSADGKEIEVSELLMQVYQAPQTDSFGNFKLPVIAFAIVLVLGYQYVKQKGKFGGGGSSGKFDDYGGSGLAGLKGLGAKKGLGKKGLGGLGSKR